MTESKRKSSYDADEFMSFEESLNEWLDIIFRLDADMDRNFNNLECRPWLKMCIAADWTEGSMGQLLNLLETGIAMPAQMQPFVYDVFKRHGLIKGISGDSRATPLYAMTHSEREKIWAREEVKLRIDEDGMSRADAIQQVAKNEEIDAKALEKVCDGKDGHMQRLKQRLAKRHTKN